MEDERRTEIACDGIEQLPTLAELETLADEYDVILLRYGVAANHNVYSDEAKDALAARLQTALPEHSVFNSGGDSEFPLTSCITILRVVSAQMVVDNEARFVQAPRAFGDTAADLMNRLAALLGIKPLDFSTIQFGGGEQTGRLDADWNYYFHGYECGFGN